MAFANCKNTQATTMYTTIATTLAISNRETDTTEFTDVVEKIASNGATNGYDSEFIKSITILLGFAPINDEINRRVSKLMIVPNMTSNICWRALTDSGSSLRDRDRSMSPLLLILRSIVSLFT